MASGGYLTEFDRALVADRIEELIARLDALSGGRTQLLPVTKSFGPEVVLAVLESGHCSVGENYGQELIAKEKAVSAEISAGTALSPVEWHMIGRIQRKKVRQLSGLVGLWQTVDRAEIVDELARRVPGARILLQINPMSIPDKGGCAPNEVEDLVERATSSGLAVEGLMAVGVMDDRTATSKTFETLSHLADNLGLTVRSMGMSDDLELAVEHGSTMVRVGRALFGERPSRPSA